MTGEFVYSSSGPVSLSTVQGFDDVDASEIKGLPPHHRLVATTKVARSHRLATVLTPYRKGHNKRLHHFMDDQGHATVLYFQDAQDRSYSIVWPKRF